MRLGSHEIPPGAMLLGAFLTLVVVLLLFTLIKNSGHTSSMKTEALSRGWEWHESTPESLNDLLRNIQDNSHPWQPSKIRSAPGTQGELYLFNFQRRNFTNSSIDGVACLVTGETPIGDPIFTIDRKSLKAVETATGLSETILTSLGSADFQSEFTVYLSGAAYDDPSGEQSAPVPSPPIEITPAFEAELFRWTRPLGQPQVWSRIHIRGSQILITRQTDPYLVTTDHWQEMRDMGDKLGIALRKEN